MNNACFDDRDNTLSGVLGHIELFVLKISHRNSQGFLSWVPEEPYPYSLVIFSSLRLFFLFLDVKGQSFVGRTRSQEAVGAQTISIGIPRGFSAGSPRIVSPILATNSQVSDSPFRQVLCCYCKSEGVGHVQWVGHPEILKVISLFEYLPTSYSKRIHVMSS